MNTYNIELSVDQHEAAEFAAWLNHHGHSAWIGDSTASYVDGESTSNCSRANEDLGELWDEYCRADATPAFVIDGDRLIGETITSAKSGDMVDYGRTLTSSKAIVKIGRGKISRDQKWASAKLESTTAMRLYVNTGGGAI